MGRHPNILMRAALSAIVFLGCNAGAAAPPTETSATDGSSWLSYNGPYSGDRFSPLQQINDGNAVDVNEVCRVRVGDLGSFQSGLVLVDGRMFLTTPQATIAMDPITCEILWKRIDGPLVPGLSNRGVAVWNDKVIRGTLDARLIAIDAATGRDVWSRPVIDSVVGAYISAAPTVWNGRIFVALANGDLGIRGQAFAFDAETGAKLWTFNLIPQKGEFGADSWSGSSAEHGGGGSWTTIAVDPEAGEIFVPVGNPGPTFNARTRKGANLFTNSFVVLDAQSGKLKWWFQLQPNDAHDWDLGAAPMLYTAPDGRKMVVVAAKDGYAYGIDRQTHKLSFKTALLPTYKNTNADLTPAGVETCPGPQSGVHWNGPALDKINRNILVGTVSWCAKIATNEKPYQPGQIYFQGSYELLGQPDGELIAFDQLTGKIRWRHRMDAPVVAAITPSAGNVAFAGDLRGNFYVMRSSDGTVLKKIYTGGALAGGLITYSAAGRQYVAVTSGNVSKVSVGGSGLPTVIVYALPVHQESANEQIVAPPTGSATLDVMIGGGLYARACSACHGPSGEGAAGPALRGIGTRKNFEQIKTWIRDPKTSAMPRLFPDVLSDQDLDSVTTYLQTLH